MTKQKAPSDVRKTEEAIYQGMWERSEAGKGKGSNSLRVSGRHLDFSPVRPIVSF